jgi:predicted ArsR family transcriptional regulator
MQFFFQPQEWITHSVYGLHRTPHMQPTEFIDELSPTRREIMRILKQRGQATIAELAERLHLVHESVRKQVLDLQQKGWVTTLCEAESGEAPATGRPPVDYCLTPAGDHFFPKDYDGLVLQMLEATKETHGADAVVELAATLTDSRVERLRNRVRGTSLRSKMEGLRAVYHDDDAFTEVESRGSDLVLVEKCCPYLNVALEQPIICSTTVSTLRRLLGHEVVRERRFQDGDQRCEFHVKVRKPVASAARFEFEPAKSER